ncbi:MAG TPA: hypothetical protein GX715_11920 [Armatimonadetes bacterium]|nr:hypothetical protein [Armatimonadota bacterium]
MAVVRVNVKEHYGTGEVWSDAGNETAAAEDVRLWCEENPPWEMRSLEPVRGDDGRYKFAVERAYGRVT